MHTAIERLRTAWRQRIGRRDPARAEDDHCAGDALCATYEEQAARGVPEAIHGLALIREGRWPGSGQPRR
jgi:hypothetical protein